MKLQFGLLVAAMMTTSAVVAGDGQIGDFDLSKVVGTEAANCKKCHPSEVAQWEKTTHFQSVQRLKYEGNSKKYADALEIEADSLMKDSVCASCHATQAKRDGAVSVVSGVSCEMCHGPAKDWLESHGTYHEGMKFESLEKLREDRQKETDAHRAARLTSVEEAGMIRPGDIYALAKNCVDCHIISNEKLIAAGHKAASNFDLVSWSGGEVRHNFFMDKDTNAAAPTAWAATGNRSAAQRDRLKSVTGTMVWVEALMRSRAKATSPVFIPQVGGLIAAGNGKLAQINGLGGTQETFTVAGKVAPALGTLFIPQQDDGKKYEAIADEIAELARQFADSNDGSTLVGLDAIIKSVPPHYSQQYQKSHPK